jgi:hypothetical protein
MALILRIHDQIGSSLVVVQLCSWLSHEILSARGISLDG